MTSLTYGLGDEKPSGLALEATYVYWTTKDGRVRRAPNVRPSLHECTARPALDRMRSAIEVVRSE